VDLVYGFSDEFDVLKSVEEQNGADGLGRQLNLVEIEDFVDTGSLSHVTADVLFAVEDRPKVCEVLLARHLQGAELINGLRQRERFGTNFHKLFYPFTHSGTPLGLTKVSPDIM
jgi:hypothetical protein